MMHRNPAARSASVTLLLALSACGEEGRSTGENAPPVRDLATDLRIEPEPERPETLFGHVVDVAVDAGGALYVLDQQAGEVRVFEADGRFARSIGRPGRGPGELGRFAWSLAITGDTIAIADWSRALLHRFRLSGEFVDAIRTPLAAGARSWWRRAWGGGYLVRSLERYTDEGNRWRGRDLLLRVTADGSVADTVLEFAYPEADLGGPGDPRVPLIVNAPIWGELPDGAIVWSDLEATSLRLEGGPGPAARGISIPAWGRSPFDPGYEATLRASLGEKIEGLGGDRSAVDAFTLVWPELLPAITGLATAPDGTIWVQRMGEPADIHPGALNSPDPPTGFGGRLWDVLDGDLRHLHTARLPERFRIYRITETGVLGVQRDAFDRETVLRLRR